MWKLWGEEREKHSVIGISFFLSFLYKFSFDGRAGQKEPVVVVYVRFGLEIMGAEIFGSAIPKEGGRRETKKLVVAGCNGSRSQRVALSGRIGSDLDYKRGGRRDIRVYNQTNSCKTKNATKHFKLTGGSSKIKE